MLMQANTQYTATAMFLRRVSHPAGKINIDQHQNQHKNQHQNTTYVGLAGDQS